MRVRGVGRAAVPGLVALAFALRLCGIRWGLPDATHFFSYHPDEFSVAGTVNGMLQTGELNPRFFHYGSATIYLTWLAAWPLFAAGIATSVVGTHVVARLVTIALGTASVALAARLGGAAGGRPAAVRAAAFLVLMPGHVLHSGFATVDVPAAFFVAASLLAASGVRAAPGARRLAVAGAAAGLAAATKYNAGLALLAPLGAVLRAGGPARRRAARAALVTGCALAAFLAATPYALLDLASFREDVGFELFEHSRTGHGNLFEGTGNGWWYHATTNLPYLTGIPLAIASLAGLGVMARRRREVDLVLLSFAIPYFGVLGFSRVRFLRYLMPLAPLLAVAGAVGLGALGGRPRLRRAALGSVLVSLAGLTALQQSVLLGEDARTRAARWMEANAPPGAGVALLHIPWYFTPPLSPWNGGPDTFEPFRAWEARRGRYRFVLCRDWDVEALRRERPEFLVESEFEWREEVRLGDPEALAFREAVRSSYRRAARFEGIPPARRRLFGRAFAPHDWLYPFAEVSVWRRAETGAP